MKPGDLCAIPTWRSHINMFENVDEQRDDGIVFESGECLLAEETGLVLRTHKHNSSTYCLVLTPRGTAGWIHEYHLRNP